MGWLNTEIPEPLHHRLRVIATREGKTIDQLLTESVRLRTVGSVDELTVARRVPRDGEMVYVPVDVLDRADRRS